MFGRILIDVDALAQRHPALDQGLDLARRDGSAVTIVDVLPDIPPSAIRVLGTATEEELVEHRRSRLAAIAAERPTPVPVETRLLRGSPAVAVVREVVGGRYDLLIRAHGRDLAETPTFGPVDLQLLRTCPCPVWLVAPQPTHPPRRLLAAVDAADPSEEAAALGRTIMTLAGALRTLEQGELTVLHVWQLFGRSLLESRMTAGELDASIAAARDEAARMLDGFRARLGDLAAGARFDVAEGEPHEVIARKVTRGECDLVIMGTAARSGLAGLLMGNTAERVLRILRGSVLAVKPPGFVSPLDG
jgi:nucleotide-binding universal stress UspA family protein